MNRAMRQKNVYTYTHPDFLRPQPIMVLLSGWSLWQGEYKVEKPKNKEFGLGMIVSGSARIYQNGQEFTVRSGDLYLRIPGRSFLMTDGPTGCLAKRYISLDGTLITDIFSDRRLAGKTIIAGDGSHAFEELFRRIHLIAMHREKGFQQQMSVAAFDLILSVGKALGTSYPYAVDKALEYVQQNHSREITLSRMSDYAGVSIPHLSRLFKQHLHQSPIQYVLTSRIESAKSMLLCTNADIKEIAHRCGFRDQLYFSSVFKKKVGITPSRFRA